MKIKIKQFEGPLDLLLQLIEEQKLDITEISLANVTEQFLHFLRSQTYLKPQALADWLVVAAKLLVIKSRVLVPSLELPPEEQEEATNLAWQLYQYKLYKEAARLLRGFESKGRQSWTRHSAFVERITFFPDPSVTTSALRDCMIYLAKMLAQITKLPRKVLEEVVTISDKIDHMQKLLAEKIEVKLQDLLATAKDKTEIIVTFLALLELIKQKILTVEQEAMFSDIIIKRRLE